MTYLYTLLFMLIVLVIDVAIAQLGSYLFGLDFYKMLFFGMTIYAYFSTRTGMCFAIPTSMA